MLSNESFAGKTNDDYDFIGDDLTPTESKPVEPTLIKKQLADGQIFCIEGYKQVEHECVPDEGLNTSNDEIFYVVLLIVLVVMTFVVIYVWRNRK